MTKRYLFPVLILISSTLETYTYMLFPFMQSLIIGCIMPDENFVNLGFWIIFIAALFRPLGGFFLGYIGDVYSRKLSLYFSLFFMSFSSLMMILIVKFSLTGKIAVLLLFIARVLQVISVSGEHAGVAIALIESLSGSKKHGLASGLAYLFSMTGTLLATIVVYNSNINNWQYAFYLSFFLIIFSFFLRFVTYEEKKDSEYNSYDESLENLETHFIACLFISAAMSGLFYFNTVFIINYFEKFAEPMNYKSFSILYLVVYTLATFFFGYISDYIKKTYFMIIFSCIGLNLGLIFTLFFKNPYFHILNILLLAIYAGPSYSFFYKLFPKKYKYRGISVAYSLGTAFIGSATPLIVSHLIADIVNVILWLNFLFFLALIGVSLSYKTLRN